MKKAKAILFVLILMSFLTMADWAYSAIFTVDNLGDADNGNPYTAGNGTNTLRKCIRLANNNPGADTINFNISGTMSPISALPAIADDGTIIDASSRWNGIWPDGQPGIALIGSSAGDSYGLWIKDADNCHIRGLFIKGFRLEGIFIEDGKFNVIGGAGLGYRNVVSANSESGIAIFGPEASNNKVSGNYIGTDVNGTNRLGNTNVGVIITNGAKSNIIGGSITDERNIISGNYQNGIDIMGSGADENKVSGNYIGVNASGLAAMGNSWSGVVVSKAKSNIIGGITEGERNVISGNNQVGVGLASGANDNKVFGNYIGTNASGIGDLGNKMHGVWVLLGAKSNIIGGTNPGERNIISGNDQNGVEIKDSNTYNNKVAGNYIGTNASGNAELGNSYNGVLIYDGAKDNEISENIIAFNNQNGVKWELQCNKITRNSMEKNKGKGIESQFSSRPFIAINDLVDNILILSGTNAYNATVEVFKADSWVNGQGKVYLGSLTSDENGNFSGSIDITGKGLTADDPIVATMLYNNERCTSEFSVSTGRLARQIIKLKKGWNLFSYSVNKCFYNVDPPPVQPKCVEMLIVENAAQWLSSVMTPPDAWQMVLGTNGAMDSSLIPEFHSLKFMTPCSGYWVKIKDDIESATLTIEGSLMSPECPIPLSPGWNLVGCTLKKGYYDTASSPVGKNVPEGTIWEQVTQPVADYVFSSIADKYDMIIGEDGAYNPNLPPAFSSLHYIAPGYGYWIKMKEGADLTYP